MKALACRTAGLQDYRNRRTVFPAQLVRLSSHFQLQFVTVPERCKASSFIFASVPVSGDDEAKFGEAVGVTLPAAVKGGSRRPNPPGAASP